MKSNLRKVLLICSISPLLMAILCEKEEALAPIVYNETKVTISESVNFSLNDTLWIKGRVSTMIFDEGLADSIRNPNEDVQDIISVLRLKKANGNSNTSEAINAFKIVSSIGSYDFLGACPTSELIAVGPPTQDGQFFEYLIGLVPQMQGDFVLSWVGSVNLLNDNLNIQILEKYPIGARVNILGLTKCGITSTLDNVRASKDEFFFSIN